MFDFFESEDTVDSRQDPGGLYLPDAAECMRCGLCVSQCPTYQLFQTYEESPRGRVKTLGKILLDDQTIDVDELTHLNNCLQCRACETVCPSQMAYGRLFDQAQARLSEGLKLSILARLAFRLIEIKNLRRALLPFIRVYIRSGLQSLIRRSGLLDRLNLTAADHLAAVPALAKLADFYPTQIARQGKVGLFTGCLSDHFDRDSLNAAITLLNAIGYDVWVSSEQTCCGAIHQHNGQQAKALLFADQNKLVFNGLDVDAVVFTATGCGAMLDEYAQDDQAGLLFQSRLFDINDFLLQHWPEQQIMKPTDLTVAVHEPCSQRNVLKNQTAVYRLLEKIPGLSVQSLPDNHLCCGSAGSYMLTHPDNADRLKALKLDTIAQAKPDVVVSANFGCALHLNTGLAKAGVQVVHPLVLLVNQLESDLQLPV
ncbi:4Fe-4S dicluster domain-containing protein [Methylicorpusculum oleiharenae]|uniref:(Fe-S)-binding protein n=1 Tax=Methylicorpusculum oleiharenae TaxID=1338687 RepID=UPI001E61EA06|nr:4Fe-4S dicluster domain-containing protein [Methylicorpusculum oleiharenae]